MHDHDSLSLCNNSMMCSTFVFRMKIMGNQGLYYVLRKLHNLLYNIYANER